MSNASLKEQLQAVASQFTPKEMIEKTKHVHKPKKKKHPSFEKMVKPKPKWLDYAQYGVELLKVYFPAAFKSASEVKPLKKGIKEDLVKALSTFSSIVIDDKACMVKSLAYYVNTLAYHKSIIEGATRIDLAGNPAGAVTAEEANYSQEKQRAKLLTRKQLTNNVQLTESENVA